MVVTEVVKKMKKLLAIFGFLLLFSSLVAGSAQAVSMYLWWPDGSTSDATFTVGDVVTYNYTGIGPNTNPINTVVYQTNMVNPPVSTLMINNTGLGGTYGVDSFSTANLTPGNYSIYGVATDLATGYDDTDYLFFELVPPTNNAPYFTSNLTLSYQYLLNLSNVNVVDLSQYGFDLDNDPLTYFVDQTNTNLSIIDCQIVSSSILNCDLNGVGNTTVDVIVSDGQANGTATINIEVINPNPSNHAPYFNASMALNYTYDLAFTTQANVVNLSAWGIDPDNDPVNYSINTANTNPAVAVCTLTSNSVIFCNFNGVGTTTLEATITDGQLSTAVIITINVINTTTGNHAPYFVGLPNINLSGCGANQLIIDLSQYGFDPDSDPLTYTFSQAPTNTNVIDNCQLIGSVLFCDAMGPGTTYVAVGVTDPTHPTVWSPLQINVGNQSCNTAPYFVGLPLFYSYHINLSNVDVVDLSQFAHDAQYDTVTFSLDQSSTNFGVVNCSLVNSTVIGVPPTPFSGPSLLNCDLFGVGNTTVDVAVSDGQFTTWVTLTIEVYNTTGNLPPYFTSNMSLYYSYNINATPVNVVDLANYAVDPNGDNMSFMINTASTNNNVASCTLVNGSIIHCDLNGVGLTTLQAGVTDGYYITWVTITIHVYSTGGINTAPYFDPNIQLYYSFNINSTPVSVVDLSQFAYDNEMDTVSFSIDQSNTNNNVVSCQLVNATSGGIPPTPFSGPSLITCDLFGVGTTTLDATVSDGQLSTTVTLTINVYSTSPSNTAPYFGGNMNLYYSYNIDLVSQADVVHLAPYAYDNEGDTVNFSLDTSNTDSSVAVCTLQLGANVPSPTPYIDPSVLHCVFNGVGTTTVNVIISDGSLSSYVTITITVYDTQSTLPVAVISSPGTSDFSGVTKTVDGSHSYSPIGLAIVNYQWSITDQYGNLLYATAGVPSFPYTFSDGQYYISLTVTDSNGGTGSTTKIYKVYKDPSADDRPEKGLKIVDYDVYGFDFERATIGGDLIISAWVENQAGEDLDNVRMTYALPEFGIRFTSQSTSIDDGDREHIVIHAQVPYDIDPGVYYPYISFSDGDIRRVKAGYLEVYE